MRGVVPQENNVNEQNVSIDLKIRTSLKPLIIIQTILGINRIHLLKCNKLKTITIKLYSFIILFSNMYLILIQNENNTSNFIVLFFYISLAMISIGESENLLIFLQKLTYFDEHLKTGMKENVASTKIFTFFCMAMVLIFNIAEQYTAKENFTELNTTFVVFLLKIAIDLEHIFQITLFRFVCIRSVNLKQHVEKVFEEEVNRYKIKVISHNNFNDLTVTEIHKVYDRLYKCCLILNRVVHLPLMVGLITTVISVDHYVMLFTSEDVFNSDDFMKELIYYGLKLIHYYLYVIIPCLYSAMTLKQSDIIRNILHSATMRYDVGNLEHRKVKAFFHLTREFNFSYTIFGAIKLDMSVPLYILSVIIVFCVIIFQINQFVSA